MQRQQFIDWARGFAVIAMVLWHTADAWLKVDARVEPAWAVLRFIGGLAAPSFLFLAGAGAALAQRAGAPARSLWSSCARGLEIVLLGYALRLQTWVVDAGALLRPELARAWLLLLAGYGLFYLSLRALERGRAHAGRWALLGLLLSIAGFLQVPALAPGRVERLLQVDVLQAIGMALIALTLAQRFGGLLDRPRWLLAGGLAVALLAGPLELIVPGSLPVPLAAYVAKFEPAPGMPKPALFPLFPWLAYAFFGAAYGTLLKRRRESSDSFVALAAVFGAALSLSTSEAHGYTQQLIASLPHGMHLLRVLYRLGLVLVLLAIGWLWVNERRGRHLVALGRASLRIYWAHMLVAYGVLGRPWQKQLVLSAWAPRFLALLLAMWLLARLRLPSRKKAAPART